MSEKPSATALSHLNLLQSDLSTRGHSRSQHHYRSNKNHNYETRQKLREIDRNSPSQPQTRSDRLPYVDGHRRETSPSSRGTNTSQNSNGVGTTSRNIVKKLGNVFRKKEKDLSEATSRHLPEQRTGRGGIETRQNRRSRSVEVTRTVDHRQQLEKHPHHYSQPQPQQAAVVTLSSTRLPPQSQTSTSQASQHTNDQSSSSYSAFLHDLKREVASDHNELWSSFQSLFHAPATPLTSQKKKRLDQETQQLFFSIHKNLVKQSANNNYSKSCQLVSDKTLLKEKWMREDVRPGGAVFLSRKERPSSRNTVETSYTSVNTSRSSSVNGQGSVNDISSVIMPQRDIRQREMVKNEMKSKGVTIDAMPQRDTRQREMVKNEMKNKGITTNDTSDEGEKENQQKKWRIRKAPGSSNSQHQSLDDANKQLNEERRNGGRQAPKELTPPRVRRHNDISQSTPPKIQHHNSKIATLTPPRNSSKITTLTPPRNFYSVGARAMSPHRTQGVSFFDGQSPAREQPASTASHGVDQNEDGMGKGKSWKGRDRHRRSDNQDVVADASTNIPKRTGNSSPVASAKDIIKRYNTPTRKSKVPNLPEKSTVVRETNTNTPEPKASSAPALPPEKGKFDATVSIFGERVAPRRNIIRPRDAKEIKENSTSYQQKRWPQLRAVRKQDDRNNSKSKSKSHWDTLETVSYDASEVEHDKSHSVSNDTMSNTECIDVSDDCGAMKQNKSNNLSHDIISEIDINVGCERGQNLHYDKKRIDETRRPKRPQEVPQSTQKNCQNDGDNDPFCADNNSLEHNDANDNESDQEDLPSLNNTPYPVSSLLEISSLSPPPAIFHLLNETLLLHPPNLILLSNSTSHEYKLTDGIVLFSANRENIQSLTLSAEATSAELVLRRNEKQKLVFKTAKDCLTFAQAFYGLEETPLTEMKRNDNHNYSKCKEVMNPPPQSINLEQELLVKRSETMKQTVSEGVTEKTTQNNKCDTFMEHETILIEKYQKMLKLNIPEGAVRHKMTRDGASEQIINHVFSSICDKKQQGLSHPENETGNTNSEVDLTAEEQKSVDKFTRMLKMKVPEGAIRHKMTLEGISEKIINIVLTNKSSAETKSSEKDDKSEIISLKPSPSGEGDPTLPYRKMLKINIPREAVRHKMIKDGLPSEIITSVLGPDRNAAKGQEQKEEQFSPSDIEQIEKYRKMLKFNIPTDAVRHKMIKDEVPPNIISTVLGYCSPNKKQSRQTSKNLIPLHWTPLSPESITQSVWSKKLFSSEKHDVSKLEELFRKKKNAAGASIAAKSESMDGKGKKMARLMDLTRANNIAIGLKAFKDFSYAELANVISDIDAFEQIKGERLQFLPGLLPNEAEIAAVAKYDPQCDGTLIPAEEFFMELRNIPRLSQKVHVLQFMGSVADNAGELSAKLTLLKTVCEQILQSTKLRRVLEMGLDIGNIMNEGTRRGGALGFKFDSLLKLTQTKSADGKMTVLDYMVMTFMAKNDREVLDLESEFSDCQTASRMVIGDLVGDVRIMRMGMNHCKTEIMKMKSEQKEKSSSGKGIEISNGSSTSSILKGAGGDPVAALFNSIVNFKKDSKGTKKETDGGEDAAVETVADDNIQYSPGVKRLEAFMKEGNEILANLEANRDDAINACKNMSVYLGETDGESSAAPILTILAEFIQKLSSGVEKYDKIKEAERSQEKLAQKKLRETEERQNRKGDVIASSCKQKKQQQKKSSQRRKHRRNGTYDNMMEEVVGVFCTDHEERGDNLVRVDPSAKAVEATIIGGDASRQKRHDIQLYAQENNYHELRNSNNIDVGINPRVLMKESLKFRSNNYDRNEDT